MSRACVLSSLVLGVKFGRAERSWPHRSYKKFSVSLHHSQRFMHTGADHNFSFIIALVSFVFARERICVALQWNLAKGKPPLTSIAASRCEKTRLSPTTMDGTASRTEVGLMSETRAEKTRKTGTR